MTTMTTIITMTTMTTMTTIITMTRKISDGKLATELWSAENPGQRLSSVFFYGCNKILFDLKVSKC